MFSIFFFKDSATTEIYTSGHTRPLHDALPIFTLGAARPDGEDWHNGQATGTWLHNLTVLLDNRNLKGQPGLWVATPLQLQDDPGHAVLVLRGRSEEHTSELQSLMRISYAVFCLKKYNTIHESKL